MATEQAWIDMRMLISMDTNLEQQIANYKIFFEEFKKFKVEVMDDPERKAEMKKLIDEKPSWSMNKIMTKYTAHKAIYDYLTEE